MILPLAILLASFSAPPPHGAPAASAAVGVGFEQRIGESLPMDGSFRDDSGRRIRFGDCFEGKPVVLIFGYSRCPQLCSVVADSTVQALKQLKGEAGAAFEVIYVSIDPTDSTRELASMKRRDLYHYGRPARAAGWRYLGSDAATVRRLADAAGFHYRFDASVGFYAHASGFIVVTPRGRISRYFLGIEYPAADLDRALDDARAGRTGSSAFGLLLLCARGLGIAGRYGPLIWKAMEAAVALTVGVVFGGIGWMLWTERRKGREGAAPP